MTCLVLGATGMLGQALVAEGRARGLDVVAAGRSGPELRVDAFDETQLRAALAEVAPAVVINSAALVDLRACEEHPDVAYAVNARAVAILAEECRSSGARLVQVSTDHYFTGDGSARHDEAAAVRLVNEYARTKFAGEAFARTCPSALVVRTNVTGFRGRPGAPTFIEWALGAIESGEAMTLFDDFHTSTMSSVDLAAAIFDLVEREATGLLNVASSQVASKHEFVLALAAALGRQGVNATGGSVSGLRPRRAESLGLDVERAERLLGRPLPDLPGTLQALLAARPAASAATAGERTAGAAT